MDHKDTLSTGHQLPGDATRPSDTLDKERTPDAETDERDNESTVSPEDYPEKNTARDADKG